MISSVETPPSPVTMTTTVFSPSSNRSPEIIASDVEGATQDKIIFHFEKNC